jgi:predicted AlkP superfamily pyrophosphatase or phosphodiesterase
MRLFLVAAVTAVCVFAATLSVAAPRVVIISLDGATPGLVWEFMQDGTIPQDRGLGLLFNNGTIALRNVTANPSLTAPGHISIATGSTAARNDIPANSFHLVGSPLSFNVSGFGAPIGGYDFPHLAEISDPTAEPLWLALRAAGKRVVAATFPGADGVNVLLPVPGGGGPILQSATKRTVDFTVPFGAFGGVGAQGFALNAAHFGPAPASTGTQLAAAGKVFFNLKQKLSPLTSFNSGGVAFNILVAALDTTNDGMENYDTLVFFDQALGIPTGPFSLPATGPAYVKAADGRSSLFHLEGSSTKAGLAFYVSRLDPDLSNVHIARYSANFIPRNPEVLADVDDINGNVGFWAPQPDFRIPERISPGFGPPFTELELEAIYADQVRSFVDYQTRVALWAMNRVPDADLVMTYIEQPDGSGHQFLMIDPRQPSDFLDPTSIGANQDPAKRARYRNYLRAAYEVANEAVHRIIEAVGIAPDGRPNSDIIAVSDHGFAPFHTAVNMAAFLASRGFDTTKVRAVTSGPAVNVYINLEGREPGGTVSRAEYLQLQEQLVEAFRQSKDTNPNYTKPGGTRLFDQVFARPTPQDISDPDFGLGTNPFVGQDSGDVYATLSLGYNFDGKQNPVVPRTGDRDATPPALRVLSLPNFYGAHGYDPRLEEMSAIFFAAGPSICRQQLREVRNIDIAPTVLSILDVEPADTVQGRAISLCPAGPHNSDR